MDDFGEKLVENNRIFQMAMDRITEKYSKLNEQNGGMDVHLNNVTMRGVSELEQTQASVEPLDDTQSTVTEALVQPEDQDEDLESTLSSHSSTLLELYPRVVNQIGKACRRQHVSEAAHSVLWRYRRMRTANPRKTTNPKPAPRRERRPHQSRSRVVHHPKTADESIISSISSISSSISSVATTACSPVRRCSDWPDRRSSERLPGGRKTVREEGRPE
ncbi:hypothetical protein NHX12_032911 [Muraenolepis orangiensis]|uniref:Uncharacterized protein n=1 Tax=Muraenolepis orangiensis TaxID=630683 RepID=A0A9Q0II87_9TELE|nr:hypothetical protein NHX12_032911 [Muraenolepis orangiensis]